MTYLQENNYGDLDSLGRKCYDLEDAGNYRGVQLQDYAGNMKANVPTFQKKTNYSPDVKASTEYATVQEMGVWSLALENNFPVVFSFLATWLKTQGIDFNAPTKDNIYGYLFERNNFACFKLELNVLKQKETETPIIQLYRLQGDGFLMETFFQKLKSDLEIAGHCFSEMEEDLDDDLDELFESEAGFELSNYLNLSFDPEIVLTWCREMVAGQHTEEVLHVLLLLAYNGENAENLNIFLQQKQQIVNALFSLLKNEENCMSLPVTRCISKVLSQLCKSKQITLTWEKVEVLGTLILGWSEQGKSNHAFPVTYSEEIQTRLAQTLSRVSVDNKPRNTGPVLQKLTNLAQSTTNKAIYSHLKNFVESVTVC